MENINYDLIKLLEIKADTIWRIENHCLNDAEEAKCHSVAVLKKILEDEKKHVEWLTEEIKMRMDAGVFK